MVVRRIATLVLAAGLLAGAAARAEPASPPLPIEWSAPTGCPSLAEVTPWLEAVLPPDVRERLEGVDAAVEITREGREFHGHVRVKHGAWSGERDVNGARCEEVARSAVVVVSVSLTEAVNADPKGVQAPPAASAAPPPAAAPAPVRGAPHREPAAPDRIVDLRPQPVPAWLLEAGGGVVTKLGAAPAVLRLDAAARRRVTHTLYLGGRVRAVPEYDAEAPDGTRAARLGLVAIAPELCDVERLALQLRGGFCARIEGGVVWASGDEVSGSRSASSGWLAVTPALTLEFGSDVRARLAVEGESRLIRPRLTLADGTQVASTPGLGVGGTLGVVIAIP